MFYSLLARFVFTILGAVVAYIVAVPFVNDISVATGIGGAIGFMIGHFAGQIVENKLRERQQFVLIDFDGRFGVRGYRSLRRTCTNDRTD